MPQDYLIRRYHAISQYICDFVISKIHHGCEEWQYERKFMERWLSCLWQLGYSMLYRLCSLPEVDFNLSSLFETTEQNSLVSYWLQYLRWDVRKQCIRGGAIDKLCLLNQKHKKTRCALMSLRIHILIVNLTIGRAVALMPTPGSKTKTFSLFFTQKIYTTEYKDRTLTPLELTW